MTGQTVFISYASQDAAVAQQVVSGLEHAGHTCWIAPRDVVPGALYASEIVRGINECRLVVLVLSAQSAASAHVGKELERASSKNRRIIALRTDATPLPSAFEYFLSESQWIEVAPGGIELAIARLVDAVQRHLNPGSIPSSIAIEATAVRSAITGRPRRGWMLGAAALLMAALAIGAVWKLWPARATTPVQATAAATSNAEDRSIAVLPFADMSAEKDQEYFSDGLAEELLNELAQIKELRVAGRTSSFSFKGKNEDLRVIGTKLGVANILEGSVRKAGNRVRITAQLIDVGDGTHLWSNTYDRELSDIFAVQEEIAMAVTGALSITLDVGAMSRANGGTTNVAAYDKYLQAQALGYRGGDLPTYERASQFYRDALALDPGFARAWYGLHKTLEQEMLVGVGGDRTPRAAEMSAAKERLVALAPQAWFTQSIRTADLVLQRKWAEAEATAKAALDSSPRPETALTYGTFLQRVGRAREAVEYMRRAAAAEPLSGAMSISLQIALDMAGLLDEAQAEYERSKTLGGSRMVSDVIAIRRAWSHNPPDKQAVEAALRSLLATVKLPSLAGITLENWDDRPAALAALRREFERQPIPGMLFVFTGDHYGDKEVVFATIRKQIVERNSPQIFFLWQFNESGWHSDPRYKDILRELGLVDYYRKSGKWPDNCKPVGTDDFECR